jgi:glutathione S-transferase
LEENPEIKVEFKALDLTKGENRSPEYLKINPFGKIPSLVDDDFILLESSAIIK